MRRSHDAILVLNAGSSSIKLSVFAERAGELALEVRGEVEGLYTAPRFVAQDLSGRVVAEESWPGRKLGHDGARGVSSRRAGACHARGAAAVDRARAGEGELTSRQRAEPARGSAEAGGGEWGQTSRDRSRSLRRRGRPARSLLSGSGTVHPSPHEGLARNPDAGRRAATHTRAGGSSVEGFLW